MAEGPSIHLFFFLLFALTVCSSGNLVGFYYDARRDYGTPSPAKALSFLKRNEGSPSQIRVFVSDDGVLKSLYNSNVPVDLFLSEARVEDLEKFKSSGVSWLKTQLMSYFRHVRIKSIVVSCTLSELVGHKGSTWLLSAMKSINSIIDSVKLHDQVKVSVALYMSTLEHLGRNHERDLHRIIDFLKKAESYLILEADIDEELSNKDAYVQAVIEKVTSVAPALRYADLSMAFAIKSSVKKNTQHRGNMTGLFVQVPAAKKLDHTELKKIKEQMFQLSVSHRELMKKFEFRRVSHNLNEPPVTTYPTIPITNPLISPVLNLPTTSTPAVITVPATNPVTITPTNPVNSSPLPVTNPVTTPVTVPGSQPVTNPVTTYPSPLGNVPVTTPSTNPVSAPIVANSPVIPGQTWCMAKTGASETALQAALDYACGLGGADCSMIQQGTSCFNPNTLQNHASYAFNSYYQKNPAPTSCDFGGTAMVVNTNPSSGACVYPSSSSSLTSTPATTVPSSTPPTVPSSTPPTVPSSTPPTVPSSTPPTVPISTPPTVPSSTPSTVPSTIPTVMPSTTPTFTPSSGTAVTGSGSPAFFNASNPASSSIFGSESPPTDNITSEAMYVSLHPFFGCIVLATSFITGKIILDM